MTFGNDDDSPPTLSELVEACGDGIYSIERINDLRIGDEFIAKAWNAIPMPVNYSWSCYGKTPEEAVARLWLALHSLT